MIPKWAKDLRYRNKSFVFTDGVRKVQFLDGGRCDSTKVKQWEVVLSFTEKEQDDE